MENEIKGKLLYKLDIKKGQAPKANPLFRML